MNWTLDTLKKYRQSAFCGGEQSVFCDRFEQLAIDEKNFCREALEAHFTASAVLLSPDKKRALFTHHKKLNRWLQLGGHADGELDLSKVALKEAEEESGLHEIALLLPDPIDLDIHWIPPGKEPGHFHYDMRFLLWSPSSDLPNCSEESNALEWFSLETPFPEESLARLLKKASIGANGAH